MSSLLMLAVVGLSHADEPVPTAEAAVPETTTEVLVGPETVTLTAAGDRAREWRLAPRDGGVEVQVRRSASVRVEGEEGDGAAPEAVTELVGDVRDGEAHLRIRTADLLGANMLILASIDQELRAMPTLEIVLPPDALGRTPLEVRGLAARATDSFRELVADLGWSLQLARVPLPEQAVGVGGTWTWTRAAEVEGVAVTERWQATLEARKGRRALVAVRMEADATAGLEVGGIVVEALALGVTGRVWVDSRLAVPQAAELDVTGGLTLSWTEAEGPRRIQGALDGTVTVVARTAGRGPGG